MNAPLGKGETIAKRSPERNSHRTAKGEADRFLAPPSEMAVVECQKVDGVKANALNQCIK